MGQIYGSYNSRYFAVHHADERLSLFRGPQPLWTRPVPGMARMIRLANNGDAWFRSPDPKNVQVWVGTHGHWEAGFHLTEFQITGTRAEKAQCNISLRSEGIVPAYTPAVP